MASFVEAWLAEQAALKQEQKRTRYRQRRAQRAREYRKKRTPEQRAAFYRSVVRPWKRGRGKLAVNLRLRIYKVVRRAGARRFGTPLALLGCSINEVREHLESQFQPGMSWDNYGHEWDVDHIRPCSKFNIFDSAEQQACFHFSNLQPLWKPEHREKNKADGVFSKQRISHW